MHIGGLAVPKGNTTHSVQNWCPHSPQMWSPMVIGCFTQEQEISLAIGSIPILDRQTGRRA